MANWDASVTPFLTPEFVSELLKNSQGINSLYGNFSTTTLSLYISKCNGQLLSNFKYL
jgi:hypothetical protein